MRVDMTAALQRFTETHRAVGHALRAKAAHEGLTVGEVAERAGLWPAAVSELFEGETWSRLDTVERVARVLRTTVSSRLKAELFWIV
jgi:transcriptional regulator with XRE-family HTH domain